MGNAKQIDASIGMIERVAQVLSELAGDGRDYTDVARAAIEAMREPTLFMMNKGGTRVPDGPLQAEEVWHAMIDATLSEQSNDKP